MSARDVSLFYLCKFSSNRATVSASVLALRSHSQDASGRFQAIYNSMRTFGKLLVL